MNKFYTDVPKYEEDHANLICLAYSKECISLTLMIIIKIVIPLPINGFSVKGRWGLRFLQY